MKYIRQPLRHELKSHIDYADYLPDDILGSNIDFVQEINGHFLVIEFKQLNEGIGTGQRILLNHLANLPEFCVLLYETGPNKQTAYEFPDMEIIALSKEDFINFIRNWTYTMRNNNGN